MELYYDIEQFMLDEADLLDERRYEEWLELMAEDIHYWMPTRSNRLARELDREISAPDEAAFFDETKEHLQQRLVRLQTGMAWAEDPPSRHASPRHQPARVGDRGPERVRRRDLVPAVPDAPRT